MQVPLRCVIALWEMRVFVGGRNGAVRGDGTLRCLTLHCGKGVYAHGLTGVDGLGTYKTMDNIGSGWYEWGLNQPLTLIRTGRS